MRVAVVSEIRPGSPRAHAINVVKTAGGFARLGHEVTVLCRAPALGSPSPAEQYGEPDLRWSFAPELETGRGATDEAFAAWSTREAEAFGADMVYARHFAGAHAGAAAGLPTVLETHAHVGDENPLLRRACEATAERALGAIVTISPRLVEYYASLGADRDRLHVVPDGVDLDLFSVPARLPEPPFAGAPGVRHAVYAGHLYDYKGIPTILDAADRLPRVHFHLVGGVPEDVERTRARAASLRNVFVHGPRPHAQVPPWLWRADCLLLPPSAEHPSAAWTSPVKLGEYLAAGPPVIASAIPGLLDWVGEPAVRWFRPDDPADLARAIEAAAAESPEQSGARRAHASGLARRFAYPARAGAILRAAIGRTQDASPGHPVA